MNFAEEYPKLGVRRLERLMRRAALVLLSLAWAGPLQAAGNHRFCGTTRDSSRTAIAAHAEREARRGNLLAASDLETSSDVGSIAVLLDEGDLALRRNTLDLASAGVEFSPDGANYRAARVDRPVAAGGGSVLRLTDDSSLAVALPFSFPFRGTAYTRVFVNSDGNLSFGEGDSASTSRSLGRFLGGPPRIAPLFADLDPAQPGASVTTRTEGDSFRVTWTDVPQFGKTDNNTFQVTLFKNGRIAFAWATGLTTLLDEGVVGIAPGKNRGGFTPVDMSVVGTVSGGAIAESFRIDNQLDLVAATRKFYRSHGDEYQQILFFTSQSLISRGTFAYENNIQNADAGTGVDIENASSQYGSTGRLESVVMMDALSKYSVVPGERINGEDTSLSLIGHEVGHRWLASATFKDGNRTSNELLGRDLAHWSFFMDSDGSYDEGNEITDLGGGQFRTAGASLGYGPLDEYLMGVRRAEDVQPVFIVRNPTGTSATDPGRDPQTGVTFQGTRRDVPMADIIAALGPRSPAPSTTLPPWRQAFVYVSVGGPADPSAVAKVDQLRQQWEPFFRTAVNQRRSVDTRLR